MTVFRWIVGVLGALFAVAGLISFVLSLAPGATGWLQRARRFRHWIWLLLLLWFNVEVWGRVVYTLIHWSH